MESKGVRVMTDKERQEDEKLKKCLQTAYGATDEQLLKELEEAEASLDASEFPGAEERMFRRFMEMEREEREKENLSEDAVQDNMAVPGMDTAGGGRGDAAVKKADEAVADTLMKLRLLSQGDHHIMNDHRLAADKNNNQDQRRDEPARACRL